MQQYSYQDVHGWLYSVRLKYLYVCGVYKKFSIEKTISWMQLVCTKYIQCHIPASWAIDNHSSELIYPFHYDYILFKMYVLATPYRKTSIDPSSHNNTLLWCEPYTCKYIYKIPIFRIHVLQPEVVVWYMNLKIQSKQWNGETEQGHVWSGHGYQSAAELAR